ncbi:winged helix-turn-helix transcriptional regulator [Azospirillum sp. B21]|uniref:ArsR/SmtB family transcription factor n=1 Tax=unclassified Azospirillum TaxID=2630922 RepID=UPI0011EEDD7D|nr:MULTISPECIES: metalloregulator ArsR/SmtB family transcription factor [unclassified Azospirillum]KAA0576231.1 winged helix-turn-helix transcriptional regulator [Azospirillum sp. B21]MDR6775595.1 DNA-binding transcriptional ArsR family regulator [Azospirillum sp. BE72]
MRDLRLDEERAIELAEIFRMLGDPNRLRIAVACLGEPLCVGDVAERVGLSAALVSHHLRVLRAARFLTARKRGKQVFYVATDDRVRCIITDMVEHVVEPAADPEDECNG